MSSDRYSCYVCVSAYCFGFGDTSQEAMTQCCTEACATSLDEWLMWNIHEDTTISDFDGALSYPIGETPILIGAKLRRKEKAGELASEHGLVSRRRGNAYRLSQEKLPLTKVAL